MLVRIIKIRCAVILPIRAHQPGRRILEGDLKKSLQEELSKSKDQTVIFEGDKNILLGETVKILEIAKEAGADKIAIAAEQAEALP